MASTGGKRLIVAVLLTCLVASAFLTQFSIVHAYTFYVEAYNNTEASSVAVDVYLDDVLIGNTPQTVDETGTHYLNINDTDPLGGSFQGWMCNGFLYIDNTFVLDDNIDYGSTTVTAIYQGTTEDPGPPSPTNGTLGTGNYTFYGANTELGGAYLEPVFVTAFFTVTGMSPQRFLVAGQYGYNISVAPQYFQYELGYYDREYWLAPNEDNINLYVLNSTLTQYTINFLDNAGVLQEYPYVAAKGYMNGSLVIVEKKKVDSVGTVNFALINGIKYAFTLDSGTSEITFGDVAMTSATGVQLVLKAINFPKETLLTYKYMHIYATRNSTTITVSYEDINEHTTSVAISITDSDSVEVYSTTETAQSFSVTWSSAIANMSYTVHATITHANYGVIPFNQYFPGDLEMDAEPFSLAFLGEIPNVNTAYLIPTLLLLFAAACFSVLSAEVGIIATLIVASILRYLNWLPVPTGLLVAAWALGMLGVIALSRRRINE